MRNKYAINGLFLTQNVTGIQRFAYEVTKALDQISEKNELVLVVPDVDYLDLPFQNISVEKYGSLKGILWEQIDYPAFLWRNECQALCLANVLPLFYRKGIITIHDVSYKANPRFFTGLRNRVSAFWHCVNYHAGFHSDMEILTVSNFSKTEIRKYYKVDAERIHVVYPAWQHMNSIHPSETLFERYPQLKKKNYFFSMASLAPNKNINWIMEAAKQHPDQLFAIAGGGRFNGDKPTNTLFLGYVSDADAKALMANCKAFLFPTLYEGFGMPPLEAAACGASQIIVSDTPCMREVYGEYASYVNPYKPEEWIIEERKNDNLKELLNKYSWKATAEAIKRLIKDTESE